MWIMLCLLHTTHVLAVKVENHCRFQHLVFWAACVLIRSFVELLNSAANSFSQRSNKNWRCSFCRVHQTLWQLFETICVHFSLISLTQIFSVFLSVSIPAFPQFQLLHNSSFSTIPASPRKYLPVFLSTRVSINSESCISFGLLAFLCVLLSSCK